MVRRNMIRVIEPSFPTEIGLMSGKILQQQGQWGWLYTKTDHGSWNGVPREYINAEISAQDTSIMFQMVARPSSSKDDIASQYTRLEYHNIS
jgi:hypothetical protein